MESRSGHSLSGPREASPWRNVMADPKVVPDNLSSALLQQIISKGDLSSAPSWRPHPDDYVIKAGPFEAAIVRHFGPRPLVRLRK